MAAAPMSSSRHVRLFRDGANQALHIPVELELPGEEATIRRDGENLILEPLRKEKSLLEVLEDLEPINEDFADVDDPPIGPKDIF